MERKTLSVSGMSCTGCEEAVEEALTDLDGVSRVEADHEGDAVEVVVEDGVADDDVVTAIEQAGYEVAGA
jgi:copper chaperone